MEACAGADVPNVADVVVQPLHLEEERADQRRPSRYLRSGESLGRCRKRYRMRYGASAAGALDGIERIVETLALHNLLDASVRVKEAGIEMENQLADVGEAEVAWLDY